MSLNLFDVPNVDYSYEAKRWVPFQPANTGRQPILFTVPASDDYYDLNEAKLEIKVRLNTAGANGVVADAGAPSNGDNTRYLWCANNFGHTLWSQMNVSLNGVLMTGQNNAYHQKAYFETILNYTPEEGKTLLAPQGWVNALNVVRSLTPTNAGTNDEPTVANWSGKTELVKLTSRLLGKAYHTFMVKPHVPVFRTGKCLVPGVQVDLELYLNPNTIFLFGTRDTTTPRKTIPVLGQDDLYVTLWMKKVTLNASLYTRLQKERTLSRGKTVKYPVVRSEIRTFSFDGRSTYWSEDNVFLNKVPIRVIVGLIRSANYNGSLPTYPFAYEKLGVTKVRQLVDGEIYPTRDLSLTGDSQAEDLVGYDRFLTASGAYTHHRVPMLQPSDWGQGNNCTLFMFNNAAGDVDSGLTRSPRKTGNVRYEIEFAAALNVNITVVIWSEYENIFEIDQFGGIIYNING